MPKNTVSDPITDQEMAFAHLVLSGTMNDRRAAEAVGLNPDTAAYTKAKPRVHAYMIEHRAAVREKLVDQGAEGLRKLNLGRDQVLARLWELANLSHELTRGSIAGQIKALAMIVAIEGLSLGLNPDRRSSPTETQPTAPPDQTQFYKSQWLREQQQQPAAKDPGDPVAGTKTPPAAPQVRHPEPAPEPKREPSAARANHTSSPNLDLAPTQPCQSLHQPQRPELGSRRNRLRLRRRSGQSRLPQAALFPEQTLLWAAPLNSKKAKFYRILQNIPLPRLE
jgi:hypothetical protein